jgi:hypothetical protein
VEEFKHSFPASQEALVETILNKAQQPPKPKKVQHSNAKDAVLSEAISFIIYSESE